MGGKHIRVYRVNRRKIIFLLVSLALSAGQVCADEREYNWEVGAQGGLGYYIGDATQHSFNNIEAAYGAQLRYKFDKHWALQAKAQGQKISFPLADSIGNNQLINIDVVGEFNFFRFGKKQYDRRVKQLTPYIFIGVGVSIYPQLDSWKAAVYVPFGLGLKWKFADRWQLHAAWQQNLYFIDDLENIIDYNNVGDLNGSNILWNDFTSSLTIGIIFEFGKEAKICKSCDF